ncbi:hypothetical protein ACFWY6_39855 [Streptomyces sp. NPDC059037]|uniref:hypothetical protein n=1 Tax=Streptomyces sp. NPDC059037 TaxID=3346710 RepID=UPI00369682C4
MAYAEKVYKVRNGRQTKQYTWRARYKKPDGTWGSEPGFPTKRIAEDWGDSQEAAIREGRWVDPDLMRKHFGVWAREWMAVQKPRGRTTMNRWERLEAHILPKWEHTPLISFNWFDVEAWARTLGCAPRTTRECVQLISRILTGAVDAKHLLVNSLYGRRLTGLSGAEQTSPPDIVARDGNEDEDDSIIATPEEVLLLARRLGPVVGLQILTFAWSGPRYEENAGLRRPNVLRRRRQKYDGGVFECAVIRVEKDTGALAEYYVRDEDGRRRCYRALEPPKNPTSVRDIDVPPFLEKLWLKFLESWPHEHVGTTPTGKLWWRSHWHSVLRPAADGRDARPKARGRAVKEEWKPIKPGLTARDLRKTHDSWQEEIGVHPVLAYEQMGHKYPGIKGTYRRPTPAMRKHRLDGLQQLFERAMANLGWTEIWPEAG